MKLPVFILALLLIPFASADLYGLVVIDDNSPTSDLLLLIDMTKAFENQYSFQGGLNSGVSRDDLRYRVTVFMHLENAVIIIGEDTSPATREVAYDAAEYLLSRGTSAIVIEQHEVESDDLLEALPDPIVEEPPEEPVIPTTPPMPPVPAPEPAPEPQPEEVVNDTIIESEEEAVYPEPGLIATDTDLAAESPAPSPTQAPPGGPDPCFELKSMEDYKRCKGVDERTGFKKFLDWLAFWN